VNFEDLVENVGLPHKEHAEKTILGAMLIDPVCVAEAAAVLAPEDFYIHAHQIIFRSMQRMSEKGISIDIITVSDFLRGNRELQAVGDIPYLAHLTEGIPRHTSIADYSRIVSEASQARKGIVACQEAQMRLLSQSEACGEVLDDLISRVSQERSSGTVSAAEVVPAVLQLMRPNGRTVISTGIQELDEMLGGGFRTKSLVVIGADPSKGKSALLRQLERAALKQCFGVHCHSVEISKEEWLFYQAAALAGVQSWKVQEPALLRPSEKDALMDALERLSEMPYLLDDTESVHINTMISKSRRSLIRFPANGDFKGYRFHTSDYLQLQDADDKEMRHRIGSIVKRKKQFAKKTDSVWVELSQLARKDGTERPVMKDLKESGDIEAVADVIILNYRPKNPDTANFTGEDELIVAKNRNGAIGSIKMFFNHETLNWESRRA
jgi:replicative DNA helicase